MISPRSDHVLEGWDPLLVNAAVEAARATVHRRPPVPPTAWRWRLLGVLLATLGAGTLASCSTDLFPPLARFRGLWIADSVAAAFMLTLSGRWLDVRPHLLLEAISIPAALTLAVIVARLRIPRWSFAVLNFLVMLIVGFGLNPTESWPAFVALVCTLVLTPMLIVGSLLGWVAAHRGSRLQADIAMFVFLGCMAVQGIGRVRTTPGVSTPHTVVKLNPKLLDACVGEYEMTPDNVYGTGAKVTVRREDDHLGWRAFRGPLDLYPQSETTFFFIKSDAQVTFLKDEKGQVMLVRRHKPGVPDSEGKKLTTP